MFCVKCGQMIAEGDRFCENCGAAAQQIHPQGRMQGQPANRNYSNPNPDRSQTWAGQTPPPVMPNGASAMGNGMAYGAGFVQGAGNMAGQAVKHASRAKRNALLSLLVVGVFAIAFILYTVFLKTGTPEDTVSKLETAMNNLDQDAVLECFDSQMNSLYSGALSLGDSLTGLPISKFAGAASGLGGLMSATGLTPKVAIEVQSVDYASKKSCVVHTKITIEYDGETQEETVDLPMVLKDRKWLISLSDLSSLYSFMS